MKTASQRYSKYVSVPSDEGVRVDQAVIIHRPVADVYSFWRRLDNLPRFMRHLKSVTTQDELHSHWIVKAAGQCLEWDAEIIEQRENEMISWRSTPGSDLDHAGSVWFTPVPGGQGTLLRLELKYVPPAGKTGEILAKIFGQDADSEISEDLRRIKAFLEMGQMPEEETGAARWVAAARDSTNAANNWVHDNAWMVIAFAALGGIALGFLLHSEMNE